jgi:1-acyl-sn-glycerol-3-phosphate acyltransferase
MSLRAQFAREYWIRALKMRQLYHRFEVKGLHVLERPGAALIAGYHGRPFAMDLLMLQVYLLDRGITCRPVVHDSFASSLIFRHLVEGMKFLVGEGKEMDDAIEAGHKLIVTPGGGRESMRHSGVRYQPDWEGRLGFVRTALRKRLPIIPAAGSGVDDQYISVVDGYKLARALKLPRKMMLFFGFGPLGPFPFSPPFPVKMTLHLGEAIAPEGDPESEFDCKAILSRVVSAVEGLLDRAREENPCAILRQREDETWT